MRGLRAGTSALAFAPPLGVPMMGYGARTGVAEGTLDPLHARALYLAADADVLLVECDLCLLAPQQAAELRARLAARSGVAPGRILVGCVHTHAGPDTGFGALLAGREPEPYVAPLFDAVVEAGARAVAAAAPARFGLGRAEASIGRNRRVADGPLDREVLVARVDRADGTPLAVLYVHGCHPTALGHDNLRYSADWVAAAGEAIAARLPGANPIFALGAHADVDPRTRGLLDLAVAGQSAGVDYERCRELGRELGAAVGDAAASLETRADVAIGAASDRIAIPTWEADDRSRRAALAALDLPDAAALGTAQLFAMERERTKGYPPGERRERLARVRRYLRDRTAARFAFSPKPEVELQVLRLADALLLALPLEATVDVGLDWKRRAPAPRAAVVSIANGWMRYLPHPRNFAERDAHLKYEVLQSTLVPDAAERLLARGEALARGLVS
ncbi:MAG TPA: hypothetical protein VHQ66_00080 [Myxococcota bacterium]|nr:hypothetical protein [Myxococcota bacterium]